MINNNLKNTSIGSAWRNTYEQNTPLAERQQIKTHVLLMERIRNARQAQNLSQRGLESQAGVRQSVIGRFECGDTDPRLTTIVSLLTALGLELSVQPIKAETPPQFEPIHACD